MNNKTMDKTEAILRRVSRVCLGFAVGIVIMALIGWISGNLVLASVKKQYVPMAPSTIFCFFIISIAFFIYITRKDVISFAERFARGSVLIVVFLCFVIFLRSFFREIIHIDIEKLFLKNPWQANSFFIGRMSFATAANFIFAGLSVFCLKRHKAMSAFFAFVVTILCGLVILGYLYRLPLMYELNVVPMAFTTALVFVFFGVGMIAFAGPSYWPLSFFIGSSVRAILARNFLPVILAVILAYDWFHAFIVLRSVNPAIIDFFISVICLFIISVLIGRISNIIGGQLDHKEASLVKLTRLLRILSDGNKILVMAKTEVELLNEICFIIVNVGGYRFAWAGFAEHNTEKTVRPVTYAGHEDGYLKLAKITWDENSQSGQGPTGQAICSGKIYSCSNIATDPRFEPWRKEALKRGYASSIALPMISHGDVLGILNIYSDQAGAFDEEEIKILKELSVNVAYGIRNLRLSIEKKMTDKALRYSEVTYRGLFESAKDGILIIDAESGCVQEVNSCLSDLLGYLPGELWGRKFWEIIGLKDIVKNESSFGELRDKGCVYHKDLQIEIKDGIRIDVEFVSNVYQIENRQVIQCNVRNITERKNAEETINKISKRHEMILNSAGEGIYGVDDEGKILFVNPAAATMLGFTIEELVGKNSHELFHYKRADGKSYPKEECPLFKSIINGGIYHGQDEVFWTKNGKMLKIEHINTPVIENEKIKGAVVVFNDIGERKRSEDSLKVHVRQGAFIAQLGRLALESLDLDVLRKEIVKGVADVLGVEYCKILELLPDGKELFLKEGVGWADGVVGSTIIEAGLESQAGYTLKSKEPVIMDDLSKETRFSGPRLLFDYKIVSGLSVVIGRREKPYGVLGAHTKYHRVFTNEDVDFLQTVANILSESIELSGVIEQLKESRKGLEQKVRERTEELVSTNEGLKKTAAELNRANRVKSEFLASMSHELRTPLNSILGFSEVLYDETFGPMNAKQKDYLNDVLQCGRHLLSLINEILDLSKIEAGRMELMFSEFSLKVLAQNCLISISERASRNNILIEIDALDDVGSIKADERKITQVFYNLLSNAVKFTPSGGRIGVCVKKTEQAIEVSVWDTGIGIAPENRDKIFEEFFQIENIYTRTREGTGLGLTLARKIVELHGGKIWAESEGLGKGSVIKFTLPVSRP